jgi:DNA-binding CsgD family transcriptional regulator
MVIDDVTAGITDIPGFDPDELVGSSVLDLVELAEADGLIRLLSSTTAKRRRHVDPLRVRLRRQGRGTCELLLAPKVRGDGYAFAMISTSTLSDHAEAAFRATLQNVPVDAYSTSMNRNAVPPRNRTLLAKLSSRELEIVTELLNGSRVPAIARKLFLAQGTVRNHLSSAYRKLGVASQQDLIDLLGG